MAKKRKSHITLPRSYDPGPGYPRETLAYLSPAEHELIRKLTDGKWNRGPKGVKSYADDSASSNGVSRGDNSGIKGNGGLGQGGQNRGGSSGGSKASGSPNGGTSTGGTSASKSTSSNTGQGGQNSGAGRDSSRGLGQGAGGSAIGRGPSTAMGQASQAAQQNAARASGTSTQWGGPRTSTSASNTQWGGSAIPQPSRAYPSQFNNDMLKFNAGRIAQNNITDPRAKMDSLHNLTQFSDVSYDPDAVQKIRDRLGYTPIGIRSNNPGNILDSKWQKSMPGYTGPMTSPNGLTYASYSDPRYGLAAQNELLGRYSDMGRNTIDSVVDRYAPVDENNSAAANRSYKEHLANSTGWGRDEALTREQVQSLGPFKTSFENGGTLFAGGPFGGTPAVSGGTQVAGIANAGLSQAATEARAKKAATGLDAIKKAATIPSAFANDPRLNIPQGAFPAAPLRSTAGTYTDPYNRPTQGPQRYSGPLDSIPSPVSIGMSAPASAFANDPRLSVPQGSYPARAQTTVAGDPRLSQTPVGAFPAARPSSQVATDPRVSQTPVGAFPAAQKPASVFAEDPRISTTPLGSLPAAKPKEIQLAWNVPPMGGSLPGQAAYGLGLWGTNRPLPTGPGAQPGTIHSQTAQTEEKPSFWQQAGDLYNTASTAVTNKVEEVKADPRYQKFSQFAKDHPKLAEWGLKMFMAPGGTPNPNGMGNPQDRSRHVKPPQPMQAPQMAQAPQSAVSTNPLTILQDLQANMIAQGASEEELAYVQSLIDELTNSQVA